MSSFREMAIVRAGYRVTCEATGRFGTIGLLVAEEPGEAKPQGEALALTTLAVVPEGGFGTVQVGGRSVSLGPARRLDSRTGVLHSPSTSLIAALPIPVEFRVNSRFAGLDAAQPARTPREVSGEGLKLVGLDSVRDLGTLSAIGATICREIGEHRLNYFDAAEITPRSSTVLRPGDAGSAISTVGGAPIGILIGVRDGRAILAPLAALLSEIAIAPLDVFAASRHEKLVLAELARCEVQRIRQAEQEHHYDPRLDQEPQTTQESSSSIMARHADVLEFEY